MIVGVLVVRFRAIVPDAVDRPERDVRSAPRIMAHLQKLDVQYFDRNPVGRLVTRVTTDIDVLNELFSSGIVTILGDLLVHHRS